MSSIPFINALNLLIFECKIEHRITGQVWLALDTGATTTILSNEALHYIGFQPEEMQDLATFGDASQPHIVPKIILPAFILKSSVKLWTAYLTCFNSQIFAYCSR